MQTEKSRTVQFMEGLALVVSAFIAIAAIAISAYRQYVLVSGTLPKNQDILVQALPYLAPLCVEGFIVYAYIRLRYTRPTNGELVTIAIYGVLMIIAAIGSNIIESNIAMGLAIQDESLAILLHVIVPAIPVFSGLVLMGMHLLAVRGTAESVKADHAEKFDQDYQTGLNEELSKQRKATARRKAAADAAAILSQLEQAEPPAPTPLPAAPQRASIGDNLRSLISKNNHAEPEIPNANGQRQP